MSDQPRWIYISPHFDDAVLSCGGLIWEQTHAGIPVEIWTICTGQAPAGRLSKFAKSVHAGWNTTTAEETLALRSEEDRKAAAIVGATVAHLGIPDAIYRKNPAGRSIYTKKIMRRPAKIDLEMGIVEKMQAAIEANRLLPDDTIVCQLTVGGHVDHRLVRMAVERLGRPLLYYIDIPYYLNFPETLPQHEKGMEYQPFPVTSQGLKAWQDGISAYASQVPALLKSDEEMRQRIEAYYKDFNGQKLLRKKRTATK